MRVQCPNCRAFIEDEHINVSTDVAFCPECDNGHQLSQIIADTAVAVDDTEVEVDIHNPPKGAWFEQRGNDIRVGAICRQRFLAIFLVPFTAVWAGGSMMGIYGSQFIEGKFDLIRSLFGIPFLIGSFFLVSITLFILFGRMEVTIRDREGEIFTGFGPFGRRKRFNTDDVRVVRQEKVISQSSKGRTMTSKVIVLDGGEPLKFASMMSDERRNFVAAVLRKLLAK